MSGKRSSLLSPRIGLQLKEASSQVPQKHKTKPKPTSMNPVVPFLRPAIIFFTVTSHSHNPEARRCSSLHQSSSCTSQPSYAIQRTISHKVKEKELHHCFLVFALFLLFLQKDLKSILCLGYTSGAKSATTQLVLFLIRVHASAFTVNWLLLLLWPGNPRTRAGF